MPVYEAKNPRSTRSVFTPRNSFAGENAGYTQHPAFRHGAGWSSLNGTRESVNAVRGVAHTLAADTVKPATSFKNSLFSFVVKIGRGRRPQVANTGICATTAPSAAAGRSSHAFPRLNWRGLFQGVFEVLFLFGMAALAWAFLVVTA